MKNNIYSLSENGIIDKIEPTQYEKEADLQEIIAANPSLLRRGIDPDYLDFYLVRREQPIDSADKSSINHVDHFFIDSEGIPVLVEVKRSSDSRIKREVVGQMFDYASNAAAFSIQDIKTSLLANTHFTGKVEDTDSFFNVVEDNLRSERYKLIFVADKIPASLESMILFIDRSSPILVCYGIELEKYVANGNILISKTIISNGAAVQGKPISETEINEWTWEKMAPVIETITGNSNIKNNIYKILSFCKEQEITIKWGKGPKYATFCVIVNSRSLFLVQTIKKKVAFIFDPAQMERILAKNISADTISGSLLSLDTENKWVNKYSDSNLVIDARLFADDKKTDCFIDFLNCWVS